MQLFYSIPAFILHQPQQLIEMSVQTAPKVPSISWCPIALQQTKKKKSWKT